MALSESIAMAPDPVTAAAPDEPLEAILARRGAEFERRFKDGECPSVVDFLTGLPADRRLAVVERLLAVELDYRAQSGVTIHEADLRLRYAEFPKLLDQAFRQQEAIEFRDSHSHSLSSTAGWDQPKELQLVLPVYRPHDMIARYRLESLLGRGGFGEVWKATDTELGRSVAIKVGRPDRLLPSELLRSEAKKAASLKHTGIVPIFDFGAAPNGHYIVSELIEGETLGQRIKRGALPTREAVGIAVQIAEALHHAHVRGLVHRDVKPGNILLRAASQEAVLTDFGVAASETDQLHEGDSAVGTWWYMSPEQARGESRNVDARSDVFSLGVVLYQMLTGRLPYLAESRESYVDQLLHRPARPLRTIDDTLDAGLEAICLKCLEKEVTGRYSTASDLARALREWREDAESAAAPIVRAPTSASHFRRIRYAGVSAAVAACLWIGWQLRRSGAPDEGSTGQPHQASIPQRDLSAADESLRVVDDWTQLLSKEPKLFAWSRGEGRARPIFDSLSETFQVNSPNHRWIATTGRQRPDDFEYRAEIHIKDWIGYGGLIWRLAADGQDRHYRCLCVEFIRLTPDEKPALRFMELVIEHASYDRLQIKTSSTFDTHPVGLPAGEWATLVCKNTAENIIVSFGEDVWTIPLSDPHLAWRSPFGAYCGMTGKGIEIMFRNAEIRHLP